MDIRRKATVVAITTTVAALAVIYAITGAHAASPVPPWEPDPGSVGSLTFYDAAGQVITGGSINDAPFAAYVQGSANGRAGDTLATLFGYQPKNGVPIGAWSGEGISQSTPYPKPSAPGLLGTSTKPLVSLTAVDGPSLSFLIGDYPNTAADAYAGLYQLRLVTSAPGTQDTAYQSADILVTGTTWAVVYPEPAVPPTTTTSAPTTTTSTTAPTTTTTAGPTTTTTTGVTTTTTAGPTTTTTAGPTTTTTTGITTTTAAPTTTTTTTAGPTTTTAVTTTTAPTTTTTAVTTTTAPTTTSTAPSTTTTKPATSTSAPATTTTAPGTTTTTDPGTTTTTAATSSTTGKATTTTAAVAGTSQTAPSAAVLGAQVSSGSSGSSLPTTGARPWTLVVWAGLALASGTVVLLLRRRRSR